MDINSQMQKSTGFLLSSLWKNNRLFIIILIFSAVYLFWGVWWGWPTSFDQHDPTRFAIKMLQHHSLDSGNRYYGAFGYQEVLSLSVIPVTILKKIFALDPTYANALMFLATRILWALSALAIVVMTYFVSKELFRNQRAALISMFLVAISPGFIAWSHIPQLDIIHAFWYTLAVLLTAAGWNRSSLKLLFFAAIIAGLTASVKYIGGFIVLAPIMVVFLRFPLSRALGYGALLMLTALTIFFITTPLATGSPIQWLPGFTADVLANQHREVDNPIALWTMPGSIWNLIGPASSILGILCAILLLFCASKFKQLPKQSWIVLAACFVPYYLGLSWQHVTAVRYLVPPTTVIVIAIGILVSLVSEMKIFRKPMPVAIVLTAIIQIPLTTSLVIGYSTDTRVKLLAWFEENSTATTQVETILNHRPFFSARPSFKELTRPHFQTESYEMEKYMDDDNSSTVRKLHDTFVELSGKDPAKYLTWVNRERIWLKKEALTFDTSVNGPVNRHSQYIVMNINTARHYILDWPGFDPESPNEKDFIQAVLDETGPFRLVAQFDPVIPEWLRYPGELWFNVSPPIRVYEISQTNTWENRWAPYLSN
ncbi:MAG: phospholipid carrier-dependent glycosyltransferase [Candidatus Brocadiaceae bacterium]|nr:phospholipid carrier-dependent glycosyltransferase [Candidatus Brocadiaceae bacterium]